MSFVLQNSANQAEIGQLRGSIKQYESLISEYKVQLEKCRRDVEDAHSQLHSQDDESRRLQQSTTLEMEKVCDAAACTIQCLSALWYIYTAQFLSALWYMSSVCLSCGLYMCTFPCTYVCLATIVLGDDSKAVQFSKRSLTVPDLCDTDL